MSRFFLSELKFGGLFEIETYQYFISLTFLGYVLKSIQTIPKAKKYTKQDIFLLRIVLSLTYMLQRKCIYALCIPA